jgi:hypothetical protein
MTADRRHKGFSPTPENMDNYICLAAPRMQRMSAETEREAIELLAGLLADAAKAGSFPPALSCALSAAHARREDSGQGARFFASPCKTPACPRHDRGS